MEYHQVRPYARVQCFLASGHAKFPCVNVALMVLLPKTAEASSIKDYRPISLIHIMGKLFSKVLANILAPKLAELVYPC
jgi:hypothetical protein